MFKKVSVAGLVALASVLSACGGGGGGDSSSGSGGSGGSGSGGTPPSATVAGPLDTVQTAVTTSVISPLVQATAGTPLQGVLLCANSIITQNTLDIADTFANGLQNPATLSSTAPAAAQAAVTALVSNLSGLLTSLASSASGATGCSGGAAGTTPSVPTSNPLAGTPLEALGAQLMTALLSAQQQLSGASSGTPLSATQLSSIVSMLSSAFSSGLSGLNPSSTTSVPVIGGVLTSVQGALAQLTTLTSAGSSGASGTAVAADLQSLAQSVVGSLLTQVLPVSGLQGAAGSGASSDLVATLQSAVASLTGGLATNPTTALPSNPLSGAGFSSLTDLVSQFTAGLPTALSGASAGSTPLSFATTLQGLLASLLAPAGGGSACILHFLGLC